MISTGTRYIACWFAALRRSHTRRRRTRRMMVVASAGGAFSRWDNLPYNANFASSVSAQKTWADQNGIDKSQISMTNMGTTDVRTGLANGGIELGFVSEPNLSAGLEAGDFVVLASSGELYPGQQMLVMLFNVRAIEEAGDLVGERFMIAYLRGVRDYINAFYYDRGTDTVVDALVKHTLVKDRALFRKMRPNWADPDGRVVVSNLDADARLLAQAGLMREVPNLSNIYASKYADYAVRYLGEYRPPR